MALADNKKVRPSVVSSQESIPTGRTEYYGISPLTPDTGLKEEVIGPFPSINALENYLNNPANECVPGTWTVTTKVKKLTKLHVARIH